MEYSVEDVLQKSAGIFPLFLLYVPDSELASEYLEAVIEDDAEQFLVATPDELVADFLLFVEALND